MYYINYIFQKNIYTKSLAIWMTITSFMVVKCNLSWTSPMLPKSNMPNWNKEKSYIYISCKEKMYSKSSVTVNIPCLPQTNIRRRGCTGTCVQGVLVAVLIVTLVFNIIFILDNRTRFRGRAEKIININEFVIDENQHIVIDKNEDLQNQNPVWNSGRCSCYFIYYVDLIWCSIIILVVNLFL